MTLLGVRLGNYGERETLALEQGWAIVCWEDLGRPLLIVQHRETPYDPMHLPFVFRS